MRASALTLCQAEPGAKAVIIAFAVLTASGAMALPRAFAQDGAAAVGSEPGTLREARGEHGTSKRARIRRLSRQASVKSTRPIPRVVQAPTAWIQPAGAVHASVGTDNRLESFAAVTAGLADIAEVEVGVSDDLGHCKPCDTVAHIPNAAFRVGIGQGLLFGWQPAVAMGFKRSLFVDTNQDMGFGNLHLVTSAAVSQLRFHLGADAWSAEIGDHRSPTEFRPFAGLEWTPGAYPLSSMMLDFRFTPVVTDVGQDRRTALRWIAGFGMRYQAFGWASVELTVRFTEEGTIQESLTNAGVLSRLNIFLM